MARYREKDEADLAWNRIRRRITRELDTAIADRREEALNTLLTEAFDNFTSLQAQGQLAELEAKYAALAEQIVEDIMPPALITATPQHSDAPLD